ncbi:MAG TPA: chemotaxis protein CheW [Bacteroidales bacterium]|nr:chemotaxis protein CheW [Bacteroidales bacterium]
MKKEELENINSYLTFKLGEEEFAAHVSKVLSIMEMVKITKVPKSPEYMQGVINLRGQVLPVVDTRIKFGMAPTEFTANTCIVVMEVEVNGEYVQVGTLVDSVQEVLEISEDQIQPPPSIGNKYKSEFISGMAKLDEHFIMMLDMDHVFSAEEMLNVQSSAEDGKQQAAEATETSGPVSG